MNLALEDILRLRDAMDQDSSRPKVNPTPVSTLQLSGGCMYGFLSYTPNEGSYQYQFVYAESVEVALECLLEEMRSKGLDPILFDVTAPFQKPNWIKEGF